MEAQWSRTKIGGKMAAFWWTADPPDQMIYRGGGSGGGRKHDGRCFRENYWPKSRNRVRNIYEFLLSVLGIVHTCIRPSETWTFRENICQLRSNLETWWLCSSSFSVDLSAHFSMKAYGSWVSSGCIFGSQLRTYARSTLSLHWLHFGVSSRRTRSVWRTAHVKEEGWPQSERCNLKKKMVELLNEKRGGAFVEVGVRVTWYVRADYVESNGECSVLFVRKF